MVEKYLQKNIYIYIPTSQFKRYLLPFDRLSQLYNYSGFTDSGNAFDVRSLHLKRV